MKQLLLADTAKYHWLHWIFGILIVAGLAYMLYLIAEPIISSRRISERRSRSISNIEYLKSKIRMFFYKLGKKTADKVKDIRTASKTSFFSARRVATLSVLTAMGLIMFMVESLFPPLFLPGAKMGLSNIFSLLTLFVLGPTEAIILVVVRTVLGSVFTGNVSTLMYSLTAGFVSVIVSTILVEFAYPHVSIVAISVVAAVMHNLTQNIVFCLVSNTPEMFGYMPWLALLGVVAGIIVGFAVWFILRAVPTKLFVSIADKFETE